MFIFGGENGGLGVIWGAGNEKAVKSSLGPVVLEIYLGEVKLE